MASTTFQVTGMSCAHCEAAIREEVAALDGVARVDVSAASGVLIVESAMPLDDTAVIEAVDEAGYAAVRV
jgi:copper chaperone